jgi:entericidin A
VLGRTNILHKHINKTGTMKKALALAFIAFIVTGCNTISGMGRDVQKVGQVITGAGGK